MEVVSISTSRKEEIVDITSEVRNAVRGFGIGDGIALVFSFHTTTAIVINEAEPRLLSDIDEFLKYVVPENRRYRHDEIDNNASAHLRATLLGNSVTIPILNGDVKLGTWQRILLIELDGPRNRRIGIQAVPGKIHHK